MSSVVSVASPSLRTSIAGSVVLHVAAAATLLLVRSSPVQLSAPMYRVNLIAAPPAVRQIGVVQPDPPAAAPAPVVTPKPTPAKAPPKMTVPRASKAPVKTPKLVTPAAKASPQAVPAPMQPLPIAGGGPIGGKGADVANVKPDGIAFPFPDYLENVVRRIALNFKPAARGALTAEVSFLIRRDGSVAQLRITRRSAVYSFDQDALAAVELASRNFGPLPSAFADDVLPVIFSFDPRLIR